eukprot:361941-Chlamydomonas_euryale.AAC.2
MSRLYANDAASLLIQLNLLDATTAGEVDLSECNLQPDCLSALLSWMEHRGERVCVRVGGSGLSIGDVCKALIVKMGHIDWIRSGRIRIRAGDEGHELDKVHAEGYLQGREISMDEAFRAVRINLEAASRMHVESANRMNRYEEDRARRAEENDKEHKELFQEIKKLHDSSKQLHDSSKRFEKGTKSLRKWFKAHTDSYEVLVTQLVRMYIRRSEDPTREVFELERDRHLIPKMPPVYERGVEWDGVLYVPKTRQLFLVEAKSALLPEHIDTMHERMERTVQFINLCSAGKLPLKEPAPTHATTELCRSWAAFAQANKVYGVIGGIGFTQRMLDAADKRGLLRVVPKEDIYDIQLPSSRELMSATPPAGGMAETDVPQTTLADARFTDNDVANDDDEEEEEEENVEVYVSK